jgi:hypothetical protein
VGALQKSGTPMDLIFQRVNADLAGGSTRILFAKEAETRAITAAVLVRNLAPAAAKAYLEGQAVNTFKPEKCTR